MTSIVGMPWTPKRCESWGEASTLTFASFTEPA
jgi:hypothetical protein